MSRWVICGAWTWLVACGGPSPLADMEPGERGRVSSIIDGDALVLDTGQSVRLVSIEAPVLYPRERPPDPHAAESARILEDLTLGRQVQLHYPGLTRDRYDRALAHVLTRDGAGPALWLNEEMVRRGGAWVRLYPDTAARGQELLEIEAEARNDQRGLWATSRYAVHPASDLPEGAAGFWIVTARLGPILPLDEEETRFPPACRRALDGAALQLEIRRDARTTCGLQDGTRVRVRGSVSDGRMDVTYPLHLEILPPD